MEKLSIKEACRHQNNLSNLINNLSYIAGSQDYMFEVKEEHYRSKALKEAEDETKDITPKREYDVKLDKVIDIINDLYNEKLNLSKAINIAKLNINIKTDDKSLPLDSAVEYNKNMRNFINSRLDSLARLKATEKENTAYGNTFDNEGRPVQYPYIYKIIKTIDYDRKKITQLQKKLLKQCDIISEEIDKAMLDKVVEYEVKYDLQTTVDDLLG